MSSNRDEKFLSVFQIVKFQNDMCSASDGSMGVCYTQAECTANGGVATGSCASDYGVCCVFKLNECGGTVSQLISYVESPNYPSPAPTGMCMYNIGKCDTGVCQYKIQFEDVMLSGPEMGDCTNDTLIVSNLAASSTAVVPTNLCGTLSGQEMYVTVTNDTTVPKITLNIASDMAKWRIKITQLQCSSGDLAPPGCLTYHTGTTGTIESYNNQAGQGELLNNHKYSHCIKPQDGYCDVSLSASDFMLGADDMIAFGTTVLTNTNTFGTAGSLIYNFTGPYVIPTMSGADNANMDTGYQISYMLLPC